MKRFEFKCFSAIFFNNTTPLPPVQCCYEVACPLGIEKLYLQAVFFFFFYNNVDGGGRRLSKIARAFVRICRFLIILCFLRSNSLSSSFTGAGSGESPGSNTNSPAREALVTSSRLSVKEDTPNY